MELDAPAKCKPSSARARGRWHCKHTHATIPKVGWELTVGGFVLTKTHSAAATISVARWSGHCARSQPARASHFHKVEIIVYLVGVVIVQAGVSR